MKKHLILISFFLLTSTLKSFAQYTGSIYVQGDFDKYYPIVFQDLSWNYNKATEFEIGRSNVHDDASWRGSLIGKFSIHTTNYGHGSNFIDVNLRAYSPYYPPMIAGWTDATSSNGDQVVIIWMKGGGSTYYFNSPVNISPIVYDGTNGRANSYQETNGPLRTYKTALDSYVNSNGLSTQGTAYFNGGGVSYFGSSVGIGTYNPGNYQLAVAGTIHSQAVLVDMNGWSDFVFKPTYKLAPLSEVKTYIDQNHHLPDVPSEEQVKKEGIDLGEMNSKLLKKIEELTLYLIDLRDENEKLSKRVYKLEKKN